MSEAVVAERPTLNTFGQPGVIELPSAEPLPDGHLSYSGALMLSESRNALTFQVLPRVTGTFRYAIIRDFEESSNNITRGQRFDRSFDVQVLLADEQSFGIDLAIGFRDFLGTGLYSSEFVVGTKQWKQLKLSFGIGWGQLGGRHSFENPISILFDQLEDRTAIDANGGGQLEASQWFRGDASLFGGVDWQLTDRASLQLEYSPDEYDRLLRFSDIDSVTPWNAAMQYRFDNDATVRGYVIGGENYGVQLSFFLDPSKRVVPAGAEPGPVPLVAGNPGGAASWTDTATMQASLAQRMSADGLQLDALDINGSTATVRVQNNRWDVEAQAAGRAARAMAQALPASVQTFTVIFQQNGLPLSSVTTQRTDLENLQNNYDGAWRTLSRAVIDGAGTSGEAPSRFNYTLSPYLATSYFDPQSPIRADIGAQLSVNYQAAPGLTFGGRFRQPIFGNLDASVRESDSVIERVRSEGYLYARESELEVNTLTAEYLWRPGDESFARVTGGYLEDMFGGLSAEVLFRPIDSRFAWGAEVNYAKQRDFDMLFGFQDYDVVTGHVSGYWDLGSGYHAQVDAGRYLAGDWGATFGLQRRFNNNVRVGGFFTLTDVPFDDFGEGSFDKGIEIEFPLSYFTGEPSRLVVSETLRSVQRDGGARLNVDNRLYGLTHEYGGPELSDGWGRYLR